MLNVAKIRGCSSLRPVPWLHTTFRKAFPYPSGVTMGIASHSPVMKGPVSKSMEEEMEDQWEFEGTRAQKVLGRQE